MFKVFFLIFAPAMTWTRVAEMRRGYAYILGTYLLPFIALDAWVEGQSLVKNGKWHPHYQMMMTYTPATVMHFEILRAVLLLVMVGVSTLLAWLAMENFQGRKNFLLVFSLVAYGFSPVFLLNLLNFMPTWNPIIVWGAGAVVTMAVLYQGIPLVLKPDPSQAFGIYLSMVIVMVMISGLVHTVLGLYLLGYVDFQHVHALQPLGHWLGQ